MPRQYTCTVPRSLRARRPYPHDQGQVVHALVLVAPVAQPAGKRRQRSPPVLHLVPELALPLRVRYVWPRRLICGR